MNVRMKQVQAANQHVAENITQVYLELSTYCNLSCRGCMRRSIDNFKPAHMDPDKAAAITDRMKSIESLERIVLLGFGEALCNPDFLPILSSLRGLGKRLVLVTNGLLLDAHIAEFLAGLPLDELWVSWDDSVDGGTPIARLGADHSLINRNIRALSGIKCAMESLNPILGIEVVLTRHNRGFLKDILRHGREIGAEKFIVTHLFPYTEELMNLTAYGEKPWRLSGIRNNGSGNGNFIMPEGNYNEKRKCPFIEKGTIVVTVDGDVAPCPELAYPHTAYYFGSGRGYGRTVFGSINLEEPLEIWNKREFAAFRGRFQSYSFSECRICPAREECYGRTVAGVDCHGNYTPCGECLWALGMVLCP